MGFVIVLLPPFFLNRAGIPNRKNLPPRKLLWPWREIKSIWLINYFPGRYCHMFLCVHCLKENVACTQNGQCCKGQCTYGRCKKDAAGGAPGTFCDRHDDCKDPPGTCCVRFVRAFSFNTFWKLCICNLRIQLFQFTLSDQSIKLWDKTSRFCGFFLRISSPKSAMPRPSGEYFRWRAIWMKEMLGYQMDEVAASLKMSLSFKLWSDNVNWKSCINTSKNLEININILELSNRGRKWTALTSKARSLWPISVRSSSQQSFSSFNN